LFVRKQVEQLVKQIAFPTELSDKVMALSSSKRFGLETCVNEVMSGVQFSSDVIFQAICSLEGELWIRADVYVRIGKAMRPVVLFDSTEPCQDMSSNDVVSMLCAVIEEIELELTTLRSEGLEIATCEDLRQAWCAVDIEQDVSKIQH
jgi:hypothetical protein